MRDKSAPELLASNPIPMDLTSRIVSQSTETLRSEASIIDRGLYFSGHRELLENRDHINACGCVKELETMRDNVKSKTIIGATRSVGDLVKVFKTHGVMSQTMRPDLGSCSASVCSSLLPSITKVSIDRNLCATYDEALGDMDLEREFTQAPSFVVYDSGDDTDVDSEFGEELARYGEIPYRNCSE